MSYLFKIILTNSRPYLYELVPPLQRSYRCLGCFKILRCRTDLYRDSFLSFTVNEWKKLDFDIKNSDSYAIFRKKNFWHLREHKFRHNFANDVNPLCSCTLETESREFLSTLPKHLSACTTLMNELNNISNAINSLNSIDFIRVILYGGNNFANVTNFRTITAPMRFIKTTKRFEEALF